MDPHQKATFKKIDKYCFNIDSILGKGSFGIVYLGQDYCTNNQYAVKQVPISVIKSAPELTEAIKNEMEVMKLMHHENLIVCYDILTTQNNYYFIMEYCNNGKKKIKNFSLFYIFKIPLTSEDKQMKVIFFKNL